MALDKKHAGTDSDALADAPSASCAVLHKDAGGNPVPCPDRAPEATDSLAAARDLIAREQQARMEACAAEIEQVLAKYGMRLDVTPARIALTPTT